MDSSNQIRSTTPYNTSNFNFQSLPRPIAHSTTTPLSISRPPSTSISLSYGSKHTQRPVFSIEDEEFRQLNEAVNNGLSQPDHLRQLSALSLTGALSLPSPTPQLRTPLSPYINSNTNQYQQLPMYVSERRNSPFPSNQYTLFSNNNNSPANPMDQGQSLLNALGLFDLQMAGLSDSAINSITNMDLSTVLPPLPPQSPSHSNSTDESSSNSVRQKKRKSTRKIACIVCHQAKTSCNGARPCDRCVRVNKASQCVDRPSKVAKKREEREKTKNRSSHKTSKKSKSENSLKEKNTTIKNSSDAASIMHVEAVPVIIKSQTESNISRGSFLDGMKAEINSNALINDNHAEAVEKIREITREINLAASSNANTLNLPDSNKISTSEPSHSHHHHSHSRHHHRKGPHTHHKRHHRQGSEEVGDRDSTDTTSTSSHESNGESSSSYTSSSDTEDEPHPDPIPPYQRYISKLLLNVHRTPYTKDLLFKDTQPGICSPVYFLAHLQEIMHVDDFKAFISYIGYKSRDVKELNNNSSSNNKDKRVIWQSKAGNLPSISFPSRFHFNWSMSPSLPMEDHPLNHFPTLIISKPNALYKRCTCSGGVCTCGAVPIGKGNSDNIGGAGLVRVMGKNESIKIENDIVGLGPTLSGRTTPLTVLSTLTIDSPATESNKINDGEFNSNPSSPDSMQTSIAASDVLPHSQPRTEANICTSSDASTQSSSPPTANPSFAETDLSDLDIHLIVHVNRSFERMFGYTQTDARHMFVREGKRALFRLTEDESLQTMHRNDMTQACVGQTEFKHFVVAITKYGSRVPALLHRRMICDSYGLFKAAIYTWIPLPVQQRAGADVRNELRAVQRTCPAVPTPPHMKVNTSSDQSSMSSSSY